MKERILVAMSGGIDSSVAAMLLLEQGYELVGITMKTWDYATSCGSTKETGCCSLDSINDARQVAVNLGFPHYVIDLREEFNRHIINNFVSEYMHGRTPNPCVLCNTFIKWEALLLRANQLNCKFIATGHYAQLKYENNRYFITQGTDLWKDQSYVLWGLSQESLRRTMLPLGKFTKEQIRQFARERGYEDLTKKSESYEICFIPNNDYRSFLKLKVENLEQQVDGGDFVSTDGKILGKHKGFPFYTIGQRKGLEIALGQPMYVVKIEAYTNRIVLGTREELQNRTMLVKDYKLMKYEKLPDNFRALVKIRYKDAGEMAIIQQDTDYLRIIFDNAVTAITPGQSAVFYHDNDLIGGGFIDF